jgi:succinate dehydrogenase / fumarate reductase membrane anchor subunit
MIMKIIKSSNFLLERGNESTNHWISQRISSVLLLPLSVVFVFNFIKVMDKPFNEALIVFQDPINNLLTVSFILASLWHYQQGMQIVLEDYIHNPRNRKLSLGINRVLCWILAILAIFSFINIYLMKV